MLNFKYTTQFKRDVKLMRRRNKDLDALKNIMKSIENEEHLSPSLKNHYLTGNWIGYQELHINPDWLLIYKVNNKDKIVIYARTGTHSDLFR